METTPKLADAGLYTDFSGLQRLRSKIGSEQTSQSDEATKQVAKQFEALFLQMMLKSMRDATDTISASDSSAESDQTRFYQEMFDKQIALDLANNENGQGLGIAAILERDLAGSREQGMEAHALADDIELIHKQINRSTASIHTEHAPEDFNEQD